MIDRHLNVAGADDIIGASASALTGIASTIAGIGRAADQQQFEQKLALLNNQQLQDLNEQLLQTNDQEQRLSILTDSLTQYSIATVQSSGMSKNVILIISGVLAVTLLVAALFLTKSSKSS